MKRIVLSLLLCSVALLSLAQKKLYYCEVKGIEKELTSGLKIVFDFGEKASYNMWGDLSSKLKFVVLRTSLFIVYAPTPKNNGSA